MNINDPADAFYLVCFVLFMLGVIILGFAVILGRTKWRRTADFLGLLGMACMMLGPFLALIGPSA